MYESGDAVLVDLLSARSVTDVRLHLPNPILDFGQRRLPAHRYYHLAGDVSANS
ncbi:MAG: hypothetical protein ACYDB7_02610 [Mycobacteriales bacterium]